VSELRTFGPGTSKKRLLLFVAGDSPSSSAARENLRNAMETAGSERFHLEIVDVFANPERALADQIMVTPTLMHLVEGSTRRLIGDLSARASLLAFLAVKG
jgi:circadian clock protein KaiB